MANPNPEPHPENLKPFPKGKSGNPGGRPKKPDIEALNKLIEADNAEPGLAKAWLAMALGDGAKLKPDYNFFKLLVEYRNGKVPDQLNLNDADSDSNEKKRINVPDVDERSKGRARRRAAGPKGKGGDVSS